jgi:nucleoside diphosphate kinase
MAIEMSYVMITPYTILKSRTGGVISRLLSRIDLDLIAGQVLAPSRDLAKRYADSVRARTIGAEQDRFVIDLISDYIEASFTPSEGRRHRVIMLLFKGESACRKLKDLVGTLHPGPKTIDMLTGETIRDTYADLVMSKYNAQEVSYFEPAVLTPPDQDTAATNMRMWAEFAKNESNIVANMQYIDPQKIERTLVIIKPDNWRYPSSRPGTIIDMFARTGLRIIACKLVPMSVAQALRFYEPVESILKKKLSPVAGSQAKSVLEEQFGFSVSDGFEQCLSETFGVEYAVEQFNRIIEFMSGTRPDQCREEDRNSPGKVKSMVLVYEGENAIDRIRSVLGPTDPLQAPGGTVRKEFGSDIMVNTAHASDSVENAKREMDVVEIQKNSLATKIEDFLSTNHRKSSRLR